MVRLFWMIEMIVMHLTLHRRDDVAIFPDSGDGASPPGIMRHRSRRNFMAYMRMAYPAARA